MEERENDASEAGGSTAEGLSRKPKKHRQGPDCNHSRKKPPPNAYEHQPNYNKASTKKSKGSSTVIIEQKGGS